VSAPAGVRPHNRGPVDASMTLLNEVMNRPLDPGYAEAAERRRRGAAPPVSATRKVVLVAVAVALGLAVTAAATALRVPRPEALQARALLTEQVAEQTARSAALQRANDAATREIADLRTQALAAQDQGLLEVLARDELAAGTAPVTGPGLRLTLTDAPVAQADPEAADPDLRVQDVDLQVVANGLWAAGAEAIAINGQRLTGLTAIRSAGSAILVDLAPLSGPYVVEAIGDPNAMQTAFARTSAGQHLSTLRNTYDISSQVSPQERLELPGSSRTRLQSAVPLTPAATDGRAGAAPDRSRDAVQPDPDDVASSGPTEGGTS
jgi:uncharacterized protein YlxW (UPF0749 family)